MILFETYLATKEMLTLTVTIKIGFPAIISPADESHGLFGKVIDGSAIFRIELKFAPPLGEHTFQTGSPKLIIISSPEVFKY